MQVVGRADGDVVDLRSVTGAPQLVDVPVEALELREEVRVGEVAVEDADRVARVEGDDEAVAGVPDRLHVPRRDVTGSTDQREALQAVNLRSGKGGIGLTAHAPAAHRHGRPTGQ